MPSLQTGRAHRARRRSSSSRRPRRWRRPGPRARCASSCRARRATAPMSPRARIADKLQAALGQPFVVENKPGAGGVVGAEQVAHAAPDGYTLIMGNAGSHGINAAVYTQLNYDVVRDFAPVSLIAQSPNVLVANPGRAVSAASRARSTRRARIPASSTSRRAARARRRTCRWSSSSTMTKHRPQPHPVQGRHAGADRHHRGHRAGDVREPAAGDGPHQVGQGARAGGHDGAALAARCRTCRRSPRAACRASRRSRGSGCSHRPARRPAIIDRLSAEVRKITQLPDVRARIEATGAEPVGSTPQEFARRIADDVDKWKRVAAAAKIRID